MDLPFTQDDFFALFGRYNAVAWPLALLLYAFGAAGLALLFRPGRRSALFLSITLAGMWAVNGVGYHWLFFRQINPAAAVFGAVFVLQALLLLAWPFGDRTFRFAAGPDARSVIGLTLMVFAMVIYPLWGWMAGHAYPHMPIFGVAPCPTTLFTIGAIMMAPWRAARWMLIVPALWAALGGSAALLLNVPQDFSLLAALALVLILGAARLAGLPVARRADPS